MNDLVSNPAVRQIGQQHGQEVIIDLRRIRPAHMVELHGSVPPERHLLEADQVGTRCGDLFGEQLAACPDVGPGDHPPKFVVCMAQ